MRTRRKHPVIPEDEKLLLVDLSNNLFTHLLETNALSDPSEAQVIAAAFFVEEYEKGWRFTKCPQKEEEEKEEQEEERQQP